MKKAVLISMDIVYKVYYSEVIALSILGCFDFVDTFKLEQNKPTKII